MNSSFEIALKVPDLHGGANASNLKLPRDGNVKVTKLVSTDAGLVFSGCFPHKKKMHSNEFFSISCPQPQISALSEWISGHTGTAPVENACNIACAQSANEVVHPATSVNAQTDRQFRGTSKEARPAMISSLALSECPLKHSEVL